MTNSILRIEALDAREFLAFVTQLAIRGIFQDQDALPVREAADDFHQVLPAFERKRQAGRVLEIIDRVDELHPGKFAGAIDRFEQAFELVS